MPRKMTPLLQEPCAKFARPEPGSYRVHDGWSKVIAKCPVKKEDLPETLRVDAKVIQRVRKNPWCQMPLKVFYGFGLNYADCLDYYLACDALPNQPENMTAPNLMAYLIPFIEEHISNVCQHSFSIILPKSNDYQLVLALYSNHDIEYTELETSEENEVIGILKEELPWVFKNQDPRWYFPRIDY